MEINAAQSAVHVLQSQVRKTASDAEQISAFTRALFEQNTQTLEQQAVDRFQHVTQQIGHALTSAYDSQPALASPLKLLMMQSTMLRSTVEVDLMAKTAGAIAQGVNKLVNMQ